MNTKKPKPYPSTLPPMPKGQVYLGKGRTFKVPDDGFFGLYLDPAATRWPRYSHSCSGEDRTGHYCAPADSEVARLNGLSPAKKAPRKAAKKAKSIMSGFGEDAKHTPALVLEVGKTYLTRDGRGVEILRLGLRDACGLTVVGIVDEVDGNQTAQQYLTSGRFNHNGEDSIEDIVQEKPDFDWSCLPPWINYIAVDEGGEWWCFSIEPAPAKHTSWDTDKTDWHSGKIPPAYAPTSTPSDWRQSLRVRPGYQPE